MNDKTPTLKETIAAEKTHTQPQVQSVSADTGTPSETTHTPIDQLPADTQEYIRQLREEAAENRVKAKDATRALAEAEKTANERLDTIAKTLGLKQDTEPPTVEELTAQIDRERTTAHTARLQLAVFQAAATQNVDANILLDSVSFRDSIKDLDPMDTDKINAAITAAKEHNPRLASQVQPVRSTVEPAGSGKHGITKAEFRRMPYDERLRLMRENRALFDQLNH